MPPVRRRVVTRVPIRFPRTRAAQDPAAMVPVNCPAQAGPCALSRHARSWTKVPRFFLGTQLYPLSPSVRAPCAGGLRAMPTTQILHAWIVPEPGDRGRQGLRRGNRGPRRWSPRGRLAQQRRRAESGCGGRGSVAATSCGGAVGRWASRCAGAKREAGSGQSSAASGRRRLSASTDAGDVGAHRCCPLRCPERRQDRSPAPRQKHPAHDPRCGRQTSLGGATMNGVDVA
jgi:hypothetical protein